MKKTVGLVATMLVLLATNAAASVTPLFSPSPLVKQAILKQIEEATTSIDIAMYSFSDYSILDAVKDAAASGVQVRLILNKAHQSQQKAEDLEDAGVDVKYVTPVMHHKFAIFDGPLKSLDDANTATLLSGSGNWSSSSSTKYDEDMLVLENEGEFVLAFQKEFNHLWHYAREFGDSREYSVIESADEQMPLAVFTSQNMTAYYTSSGDPSFKPAVDWSEGVAGKTIISEINQAESVIRIASAHFRRSDIFDALVQALERGVKVQMLLDQQEFHSYNDPSQPTYYDEKLAELGAEVKYKTYSRYWDYKTAKQMHAKYMLVDDMTLVTGSFNWSRNAEVNVMENLVRLTDEQLGQSYFEHFQEVWAYGEGELETLENQVFELSGQGPCHFAPISMTGAELQKLRSGYATGACR
jgi:phosphatidylserine/phosphatidylglycerophosphate/cardiolipin synthase-like enzyme